MKVQDRISRRLVFPLLVCALAICASVTSGGAYAGGLYVGKPDSATRTVPSVMVDRGGYRRVHPRRHHHVLRSKSVSANRVLAQAGVSSSRCGAYWASLDDGPLYVQDPVKFGHCFVA